MEDSDRVQGSQDGGRVCLPMPGMQATGRIVSGKGDHRKMINRALFSSANGCWKTPADFYAALDAEFHFDDDPCPEAGMFGLDRVWGQCSYVNPPYSNIRAWMEKGLAEYRLGKTVVFNVPARSDTKWFHEIVLPHATEIRFIKGRLRFDGAKNSAPFPSAIIIFKARAPMPSRARRRR